MRGFIICWAHVEDKPAPQDLEKTNVIKLPGVSVAKIYYQLHLLETCAGNPYHVCSGVWSAERHNQCDMIGMATILTGVSNEIICGAQSGTVVMNKLTNGEFSMPLHVFTDSYSRFCCVAAHHLKYQAEKGVYFHVAHIREKLAERMLCS